MIYIYFETFQSLWLTNIVIGSSAYSTFQVWQVFSACLKVAWTWISFLNSIHLVMCNCRSIPINQHQQPRQNSWDFDIWMNIPMVALNETITSGKYERESALKCLYTQCFTTKKLIYRLNDQWEYKEELLSFMCLRALSVTIKYGFVRE
jgi:hypothetical protein